MRTSRYLPETWKNWEMKNFMKALWKISVFPEMETALPELYHLLKASESISDHNRILASYHEGRLYLVVVEDRSLKICNSFAAMDFVTAEYFLFMVLKRLQMNPEISSVHFMTPLTGGQKMSLYRYFKSVEQL